MNTTDRFLCNVMAKVSTPLPDKIIHHVRRCLLDYLGATLAGSKMLGDRGIQLIKNLDFAPHTQPVRQPLLHKLNTNATNIKTMSQIHLVALRS